MHNDTLSYRKLQRLIRFWVMAGGIVLCAGEVRCQEVDGATARSVAAAFYREQQALGEKKAVASPARTDFLLLRDASVSGFPDKKEDASVADTVADGLPDYYFFNVRGNRGFVIVSGDQSRIPVPAFSMKGSYDPQHVPPACRLWLSDERIRSGRFRQAWNRYLGISGKKSADDMEAIGPLLSATWGQACFYNGHCPEDKRSPCKRVYTGCTAVAMGQIMHYWKHPLSHGSIPGYEDDVNRDAGGNPIPGSGYGWIPAIGSSPYLWAEMPDELTGSSSLSGREAVSRLLFHCGVACRTNFGPLASGSTCSDAASALDHYFGYDHSLRIIERSDFTTENWAAVIRSEIDRNMPVLYTGTGPEGAHAFVCDGYTSDGYFHMNWGWEGRANGYYYLFDLTPGELGFTSSQKAVIGIRPEAGGGDPCLHAVSIEGAGPEFEHTFYSERTGSNDGEICGWSTPGYEQVYSFRPDRSGRYNIRVTSAEGYVDCGWKAEDCNGSGWICAGEINGPGTYGSMEWEEGTTYYLLFDGVDVRTGPLEFHISREVATSTDGPSIVSEMKVYPNPVSGLLHLELPVDRDPPVTVMLTGPEGRVVLSRVIRDVSSGNPVTLDLSGMPVGIYCLHAASRRFQTTHKVVVQ